MAASLPPISIVPPGGVVKTEAIRVIEGRWSDSDMIRFYQGQPEKRGGWSKAFDVPTSGVPRAIHAWRDNQTRNFMAAGTYRKLYVYDFNNAQNDITPFQQTGTLGTDPFTTTSGSNMVSVNDPGHNVNPGDTVIFSGATAVGGITPNGTFIVSTVTDANNYIFQFTSNATSSASGGGAAVAYSYEVGIGTELGSYGLGWGVGGWGLGTWGTPRESSTIFIEPRIWSLDHFGQILLAAYNGGTIYSFDPTAPQPWGRAQQIADAPDNVRAMFITPERFVFALCEDMVVAWCSQNDPSNWTPDSVGSTALSRTLTEGTKLVGGKVLGPFVSLVWTDAALYLFQYTGTQFVYNSSIAGKDCGLIAPNAAVTIDGVAYWMGRSDFWMFNGSIQKMPRANDIQDFVFRILNDQALFQCHAAYNPLKSEIEFFYTEIGSDSPNKSVTYSIKDQCWATHILNRTSSTHYTQGDIRPYMGADNGFIYLHEDGYDNDGAILPWRLELAPYALNEGIVGMEIEGMVFDFFDQVGDIQLLIECWDRMTDEDPMDTETDVLTVRHGLTDTRVSGRYIGITLSQAVLGGTMRLGKPVAFPKQAGRRR